MVAETIVAFARLTPEQQARFLTWLSHGLTVSARESLIPLESIDVAKARIHNEMLHKTLGALGAILAGSDQRYPDDALIAGLFLQAREAGIEERFQREWQRVMLLVASPTSGRKWQASARRR